jgi:hypothetical protein
MVSHVGVHLLMPVPCLIHGTRRQRWHFGGDSRDASSAQQSAWLPRGADAAQAFRCYGAHYSFGSQEPDQLD